MKIILLIDDNKKYTKIVVSGLWFYGHSVDIAKGVKFAWEDVG